MDSFFYRHKILEFLKKNGKSPQTKISTLLNIQYYRCVTILDDMVREGILKLEKKGKTRYYEIMDKRGGEVKHAR